ncbi:glycolipid transfer protein domain-containing protein [Mycena floridula]|nr:glycolipid transfer protein domain-containing protein [Mycena floridula]
MAPYFETVKSFADVQSDNEVPTDTFLEASDGLVHLFDLLGNGVFAFVQSDIRANIKGVRNRYDATQDQSRTLESLVQNDEHKDGTRCLVRLIRGLTFTCVALQNLQNDTSSELRVCFRRSYDSVLKHHHNFGIRSVVYVALRTVPHREDFYRRIAQGGDREKLDSELTRWLDGLDKIVKKMKSFLESGGWGTI